MDNMDKLRHPSQEIGLCGVCNYTGPLQEVQDHFLRDHVQSVTEVEQEEPPEKPLSVENNNEDVNKINGGESPSSLTTGPSPMHWTPECVLLLIRCIEKHYSEFNSGLKKNVYIKIANEMGNATNKVFTYEQIESKWKGLKKTYKNVKDHNNKSGNSLKRWQYFNAMDAFMANKPEIEPKAVCSSTSDTVIIKENTTNTKQDDNSENLVSQSILGRKRRITETAIHKRHQEKMSKFDKFLKLFQKSVEHQTGEKFDDEENP